MTDKMSDSEGYFSVTHLRETADVATATSSVATTSDSESSSVSDSESQEPHRPLRDPLLIKLREDMEALHKIPCELDALRAEIRGNRSWLSSIIGSGVLAFVIGFTAVIAYPKITLV